MEGSKDCAVYMFFLSEIGKCRWLSLYWHSETFKLIQKRWLYYVIMGLALCSVVFLSRSVINGAHDYHMLPLLSGHAFASTTLFIFVTAVWCV